MNIILLCLIFFSIASLYASVGFGGGSSYIAILLLVGVGLQEVRFTALICNIVVVGSASINYAKHDLIPWKKITPILLLSVPLAFLGGTLQLDGKIYKLIAAVALIIAAIFMISWSSNKNIAKKLNRNALSLLGGGIGFLSGVIGIGGGIFLAPILHLIRWETVKTISVTASLFILVNSLAGIAGQIIALPSINYLHTIYLAIAVFLGGQIGNQANINWLSAKKIRFLTAILIATAGIRILYTQL